ncbi:MAG: CheR family methyltransferase [Promethearchaeota archaeon]
MLIKVECSEKDLNQIELLLKSINVNLFSLKKSHVLRRIRVRMMRTGCKTISEYYRYVQTHEKEKEELYLTFSINVTRFFRNADTFHFIKQEVFPKLLHRKDRHKPLKIWSAGCADGAEAYTLAIMCKQFNLRPTRVKILATDYNRQLLVKAEEGIYPVEYLSEITKEQKQLCFTQISKDSIQINPELKPFIEFRKHNLTQENSLLPDTDFDLILCRNVLIYFTRDQQEPIFQMFYEKLKPMGFLILGRTEILPISRYEQFSIFSPTHRIVRKK